MDPQELFNKENNPNEQKGSPLKSLETDLILYSDSIKEIAMEIIQEDVSKYPLFIAHQHELSIGELIIDMNELSTEWNIHVSTVEEFVERGIIQKDKKDFFVKNYKDPEKFMCVFVIMPEGANFVFYPYK
jgi:hypothetical protein